jgi:hypothetical protein
MNIYEKYVGPIKRSLMGRGINKTILLLSILRLFHGN